MAIRISFKQNDRGRVGSVTVTTLGVPGEACMLSTADIAKLNPGAIVTATQEMYPEEQSPIQMTLDQTAE